MQRRQLRMLRRAHHTSAMLTQTCPSTSTRRTLAEGCCSHKTARTYWEEPPQRNVSLENIPCEKRLGELEIMKVEMKKNYLQLCILFLRCKKCLHVGRLLSSCMAARTRAMGWNCRKIDFGIKSHEKRGKP